MKKTKHMFRHIRMNSIASEMELEPGDELLAINGQEIEDIFDYRYLINDEYIELLVKKVNGEEWVLEIEKKYEEDLGIEFESNLMDEYRTCTNRCIFCFIDQMPPGMRDTLYLKDDDSRLSFLQGNYVTLTNMNDHDIDRIIQYHLSPINISFQTTNPVLRCKMLGNRFAGEIFSKVDRLYHAGIEMNGQIVLCKGINDKQELERTISDLYRYLPCLKSISVVPVGLSKYRDGLYPLKEFHKEDAAEVLDVIHRWQQKAYEEFELHFIHGGDEWYLLAGEEFPEESTYDGYLQLENGVGMLRLFEEEVRTALSHQTGDDRVIELSIATGLLAYPFIKKYAGWIQKRYPHVNCHVYGITNHFFGEKITVSGLLTGYDIIEQLKGKVLGEFLLLPINMLRSQETVFLDDKTVADIEKELQIPIEIAERSGQDFVDAVLKKTKGKASKRRQMYEQTNCSNCRTS